MLVWKHEGNKAIITGDTKCMEYRNGNWEMYDLKNTELNPTILLTKKNEV